MNADRRYLCLLSRERQALSTDSLCAYLLLAHGVVCFDVAHV